MGSITQREIEILQRLKNGKSVSQIAKEVGVSITSISRSISRVRMKCMEIEDDVKILREVGFLDVKDGNLIFISRDPKALGKDNASKTIKE
jgi:predicted DNA-binding protein YlxM (UPF0122 family)